MGLLRTAPWRLSPAACARRFEADPSNAALALAVAQAEHAHARLGEAARWARRALALDPNAAEGYVLVARAEVENGRPEEAREAYRHYLELAPRGWHQAEARAAVRRARTKAPSIRPAIADPGRFEAAVQLGDHAGRERDRAARLLFRTPVGPAAAGR